MTDDELDRMLRSSLASYDAPRDRVTEVRDAAHRELRASARRVRQGWRAFEATASLAVAAAQLVWVISTLFGR